MTFEEAIHLLTTSRRYRTLLIPAIFLNVSSKKSIHFNLSEKQDQFRSRDGKKQKISVMRDTLIFTQFM